MMISVAMATYNGEKYLREQLDSVLNQTITDLELVICDDNSTDSTIDILSEYAAKDRRIRYYTNPVNLGFKRNFENVIQKCKGEYIALCDQDDIWYPYHLEKLLDNIQHYVMCCGNSELVDQNNQTLHRCMSDSSGITVIPSNPHKWIYRILLNSSPFQGASMLLKADFVKRCLPIPNCMSYHDVWFAGCACMDKYGLKYFLTPSITRYRQHYNNVTLGQYRDHKRTIYQQIKDYWFILQKHSGILTNRYQMCKELGIRFPNTENSDYQRIAEFLIHSEQKKLKSRDLKFLWNNMEYVMTSITKKGFLRKLYVWSHSKSPIVSANQ